MSKVKIKWNKLIERRAETLVLSQIAIAKKYYPKVIGIRFKPFNIKYENWYYYTDAYSIKQESLAFQKTLAKNSNFFEKIGDKMYKKGEKLIKIVKETQNKLKLKSKEELINLFKRYNDAFTYFAVFAWAPLTIEKILSENITARLKTIFPGLKEEDYKNDLLDSSSQRNFLTGN